VKKSMAALLDSLWGPCITVGYDRIDLQLPDLRTSKIRYEVVTEADSKRRSL